MTKGANVPLTAAGTRRQQFLERYTARTNIALSALALVYLLTFSIQSIWYQPQATWFGWLVLFGYALWLLFAIDLAFRFVVSPIKRHFFRKNWLDTVTVVIPQFRALRALRAFMPNGVLAHERSRGVITGGAVTTAALGAIIVVWVGSLMVLNAERGAPGADITSAGDAVWWAFETVTTVGYGDFVPVTWNGRAMAVLIMLVGISALGAVTATLSATLVKSRQGTPAPTPASATDTAPSPVQAAHTGPESVDDIKADLAEIKAMLTALQNRLDRDDQTG